MLETILIFVVVLALFFIKQIVLRNIKKQDAATAELEKRLADELRDKLRNDLIYTSGYVEKELLSDSLAMA